MIDVVYKMGSGSKYNNDELRYSLRSLSNFKDLGKVYIIGYCPDWVKNVIHYPLVDSYKSNKDANLINKILLASLDKSISTEFLNFSDDQVLLKECSYEDFKDPYYNNNMSNFKPGESLSRWKKRLQNTINALKEYGQTFNCYECHIPTLIHKYDYLNTVLKYAYGETPGLCGNTLYFNTIKKLGIELPKGVALRMQNTINDLPILEKECEGKLHLNYDEISTNDILFVYLANKFPAKSIYEI